MSWTDERVATLTKMWKDGRSAAEIAKELGGVTRNAVIGKANRLGLSGRTTTSTAKKKKAEPKKTGKAATTKQKKAAPKKKQDKKKPKASAAQQKIITEAIKQAAAEADQVLAEGIGLLDLTEKLCKWPIGDPQENDFHFCGQGSLPNLPYCEEHAALAYQTPRKQGATGKTKGALKIVGDKDDDDDEDLDDDIDVDDIDDIDDSDDDDDDTIKTTG